MSRNTDKIYAAFEAEGYDVGNVVVFYDVRAGLPGWWCEPVGNQNKLWANYIGRNISQTLRNISVGYAQLPDK